MNKMQRDVSGFYRIALITGLCVLVGLCAFMGISLLYQYTSEQMYHESVSQLVEISDQLFEKLDVQIDIQWDYLEKLSATLEDAGTVTREELSDKLRHSEDDLSPIGTRIYLRVITDDGHYYTDEGRQGMWTGYDSLSGAEKQSFLISNWLEDETYMAFALKADGPVTVDGHRAEYFVLLRTMDDMQPFFHSSAFEGRNVAYIINYDGFVLSFSGALEGIDFTGKNVYHKMEEQIYPHVKSFSSVMEMGDPSGTVCTDVIINGERYYLVYNRLPSYDWAALLIMSASDVAVSASKMVSSLLQIFIVVVCVLILLMATGFFLMSRIVHSRKLLTVEENARRRLEKEQEKTEAALGEAKKATKAKSQFLANMSHDIRTPMNAIMGVTSLMEHDVDNPETLRYYIRKLRQSGSYMLGLINDILDMSKIESGDVSLNPGSVKLAEQVGQVESIIRSQCNEKGQEFTVAVHGISHEYLIGDSIRLRQILLNLLTNAVKYTPSGGFVRFEIEERPCEDEGHATFFFSVIDNGHGMKKEFLEHIFEPFTREISSTTNKIQGTGLGMSITKSLIDLMGGTITVESEVEKGSRFDVTLTLPVDSEAEYGGDIRNVLLVSVDDVLIENVRAALEVTPAELRISSSPDEAVSLLSRAPSDTVILSGSIESDSLPETVKKIRDAAPDASVIFCCDSAPREDSGRILSESGVDGLIARPFFYENLAVAVRSKSGRETAEVHEKEHSVLSGKRFLCAEDNALNAEILEALLSLHGATCTICPDGSEIVRVFETVKPGEYDAVLMDVQMPNLNGLDATRAIRSGGNPLGRTIPIIAMTANAFSSDVEECYAAGMDAHLSKPIDMTAMERTVHAVLSEKSRGGDCPEMPVLKEDSAFSVVRKPYNTEGEETHS